MKRKHQVVCLVAAFCAAVVLAGPVLSRAADSAAPALDETLYMPVAVGTPAMIEEPVPFAGAGLQSVLDDFNRIDGPIGPNWTVHDGSCSVSGNAAVCSGAPGRATFNSAPGNGNTAEADVSVVGTTLQYTGLLLNYGAGASNLFLKVQQQDSGNLFDHAACYTGDSGGSFGLGFFTLDAPFATAHMKATRVGDDVTIEFTNIDGGAQSDQTYVCSGAPAPEGTGVGILGYVGIARLDNFAVGAACESDNECDDGLFCTGVETCDNGTCVTSGDPCHGETPVCDEDSDACVECLGDEDCGEAELCLDGMCVPPCELIVTYKPILSEKLTKPRKVILTVTSPDEIFDIFGFIDLGPFAWDKVNFNQRKNRLRIKAIVPEGLAPGAYPISVGDCFGEVVVE